MSTMHTQPTSVEPVSGAASHQAYLYSKHNLEITHDEGARTCILRLTGPEREQEILTINLNGVQPRLAQQLLGFVQKNSSFLIASIGDGKETFFLPTCLLDLMTVVDGWNQYVAKNTGTDAEPVTIKTTVGGQLCTSPNNLWSTYAAAYLGGLGDKYPDFIQSNEISLYKFAGNEAVVRCTFPDLVAEQCNSPGKEHLWWADIKANPGSGLVYLLHAALGVQPRETGFYKATNWSTPIVLPGRGDSNSDIIAGPIPLTFSGAHEYSLPCYRVTRDQPPETYNPLLIVAPKARAIIAVDPLDAPKGPNNLFVHAGERFERGDLQDSQCLVNEVLRSWIELHKGSFAVVCSSLEEVQEKFTDGTKISLTVAERKKLTQVQSDLEALREALIVTRDAIVATSTEDNPRRTADFRTLAELIALKQAAISAIFAGVSREHDVTLGRRGFKLAVAGIFISVVTPIVSYFWPQKEKPATPTPTTTTAPLTPK